MLAFIWDPMLGSLFKVASGKLPYLLKRDADFEVDRVRLDGHRPLKLLVIGQKVIQEPPLSLAAPASIRTKDEDQKGKGCRPRFKHV